MKQLSFIGWIDDCLEEKETPAWAPPGSLEEKTATEDLVPLLPIGSQNTLWRTDGHEG